MNKKIFDIERDKTYPYFCEACLAGKEALEISPDPRYCQACYDILLKEAAMDNSRRIIPWKPISMPSEASTTSEKEGEKDAQVSGDMRRIMSTLGGTKNEVDIIPPSVTYAGRNKRGRKHRVLPEDLIMRWASEGMGSKAIASRLKKTGVEVSYKTIQRLLAGER